MFYIEVILPLNLPKTLTYSVNKDEFIFIEKGVRVAVPLKNKIYTSIVVDKHQSKPATYEPKEIFQIIDENPIVTENQLQLWNWIASYYMCSIGDVCRAALPSGFLLESETIITLQSKTEVDNKDLTDDEFQILEALQFQSSLTIHQVASILDKKKVLHILYSMMERNLISIHDELFETYKPKLVSYLKLNPIYQDTEKLQELLQSLRSENHKNCVLAYFQMQTQFKKPISKKTFKEFCGVSGAVLKSMIDKEIFVLYQLQEDRVQYESKNETRIPELSIEQNIAFEEIKEKLVDKEVVLLHGVTSSGKTEIYAHTIRDYLQKGKQILYLLPEIALTTQLVDRLRKYFGEQVAVFHSKYSNHERVEIWKNVLNNEPKAQVILGARSALFLPFSNLGLVIIDEEHEPSFKQNDPSPRYHARDTSIVMANLFEAKVILGSATPSVETYLNAENNKYGLVKLTKRYSNVPLPSIEIIDLKDMHFRKRMKGHFSWPLLEKIENAFQAGEQVILFQNRRGFSPVVECLSCGTIPGCPHCDVSLTYHKIKNHLRCHYCGYTIAMPTNCHHCQSKNLDTKGFGTEQIELELKEYFPDKVIKRMDHDTTRGKYDVEKIIDAFKNQEIDVLVGTQMLAKGLDFENVSLVGIMNADSMLYFPDFRAFERSFQLITQVSGRAGRAEKTGMVCVQTYQPQHKVLQHVINYDFPSFYSEQLEERKIFNYPPFSKMIKITFKNRDYEKVKNGSLWFLEVLKQHTSATILGPEEPAISKIKNEYIRNITVKINNDLSLSQTKKTIQKVLDSFQSISLYRAIKVTVNVDYY